METIIKIIFCVVMTAGETQERYFTLTKVDNEKCFYEIHKSEAYYIKKTFHVPVDTQVINTKLLYIQTQ